VKKIPRFKNDVEARRFWQTHSFKDYQIDTSETEIKFVKRTKKTVAIRLDPEDIKAIAKIAEKKGLTYTSLLRMWIKEYLAKESQHVA
jgi:predicted DNA binding CopG/RHH family protein